MADRVVSVITADFVIDFIYTIKSVNETRFTGFSLIFSDINKSLFTVNNVIIISVVNGRKSASFLIKRNNYENVFFPALGNISDIMLIIGNSCSGDAA